MNPPAKMVAKATVGKKKLRTVQSGIGISSLDKSGGGSASSSLEQSFLTSRTARVLLAGAGFLADAVRSQLDYSLESFKGDIFQVSYASC